MNPLTLTTALPALAVPVLMITCICLIFLYYRKVKAINAVIRGVDLIKEQDLGSRLRPVGQNDADKIIELFNRMIKQLKDEKLKLQEQEHLLNLLVENTPMGVLILDFDGRVTLANSAAEEFLQAGEEFIGKKIGDIDSPMAREIAQIGLGGEKTVRLGDSRIYRCSMLSFMDRGFVRPFVLVENLTQEVMKAERKAYEKTIRMMSHEVQNTVTGVISSLEAIKEGIGEISTKEASSEEGSYSGQSALDGTAELIDACTERTREMSLFVKQFADIAKIPEPVLQKTDIVEFFSGCRLFLESLCSGKDISLEYSMPAGAVYIMLDTTLFEQVVINIVKNAVESIADASAGSGISGSDSQGNTVSGHSEAKDTVSGHIKVTVSAVPDNSAPGTGLGAVSVDISNNGAPIPQETAPKLFTPFFTTKPNGQGLGLTFIREVLASHNCRFRLQTKEDGLTHFLMEFK